MGRQYGYVATVVLALFPLSTGKLRLLLIALSTTTWLGLIVLTWRHRRVRIALLAITTAKAIFLIAPGSASYDRAALRNEYAAALRRYRGVTYFWGGETPFGIDCSGLMRRGLIDACAIHGIRTLNPQLARAALYLWLHDESAKEMGEGYLGLTHRAFPAPSLNALDYNRLRPGDMAVTESGIHVLAYLGDHTWVEADPTVGKVIELSAPNQENAWFATPVNIVSWILLEPRTPH